jgi:hypothetical protein
LGRSGIGRAVGAQRRKEGATFDAESDQGREQLLVRSGELRNALGGAIAAEGFHQIHSETPDQEQRKCPDDETENDADRKAGEQFHAYVHLRSGFSDGRISSRSVLIFCLPPSFPRARGRAC